MRILLDTHAFFWWTTKHDRLSRAALQCIEDRANEVLVSAVTAWELAFKSQLGKWPAGGPVADSIDRIV